MNGLAGKERQSTSKRRISLYLAMSARLVIRKSLLAYFNWIEKVKEKLKILNSHESLATRMKREKKSQPLQPQATKTSLIRLTRWIEKRRKEQRPRKRNRKKRINCRQYSPSPAEKWRLWRPTSVVEGQPQTLNGRPRPLRGRPFTQ